MRQSMVASKLGVAWGKCVIVVVKHIMQKGRLLVSPSWILKKGVLFFVLMGMMIVQNVKFRTIQFLNKLGKLYCGCWRRSRAVPHLFRLWTGWSAYICIHNRLVWKLLQQEWYFFQCVTLGVREAFLPVDEVLQWSFLLDLFRSATYITSERGVTQLPTK